jgi:basic amino acid/polyamine antiporter, APA family
VSNSGTLFAFLMVAVAVMVLRRRDPSRHRPFRTPAIWIIGPLAAAGCIWLFAYLPLRTQLFFPAWAAAGLVLYFLYGYRKSNVGRGITEVPEGDADIPPQPVPPLPGAPTPGGKDA